MKTIWVKADGEGKITAAVEVERFAIGMQAVEVDDGFELASIADYRLKGGKLEYTGEGTAAREEAEKEARENARAVSQLDAVLKAQAKAAVAAMPLATMSATEVADVDTLLPEWEPGMSLEQNDAVRRSGTVYRASQAIPETQEQYPPETAGEALYYPVEIAPDGVVVYRACHGQYDAVRKGERRHYPDASGPVYESLVDYNAYSPDVRPKDWKLVADADTE